ncbi:UNVERIFIED_CONTAM: hypothetical protein FKN15_020689 [Acipenser sinensis]
MEQSPKSVLEGSLQSQAGVSVPPDMEGEESGMATGSKPDALQRSSLSEPQQAEAAVTAVAVLGGEEESGAVKVERAAKELTAVDGRADSRNFTLGEHLHTQYKLKEYAEQTTSANMDKQKQNSLEEILYYKPSPFFESFIFYSLVSVFNLLCPESDSSHSFKQNQILAFIVHDMSKP